MVDCHFVEIVAYEHIKISTLPHEMLKPFTVASSHACLTEGQRIRRKGPAVRCDAEFCESGVTWTCATVLMI